MRIHAGSSNFCPCNTLCRARRQRENADAGRAYALREVDVEEVEVESGLHDAGGDGNGVHHVLREVPDPHVSICAWWKYTWQTWAMTYL